MKGEKLFRGNEAGLGWVGLEELYDSHVNIAKKYEEQRNIVNKIVAFSREYNGPLAHLNQVIS